MLSAIIRRFRFPYGDKLARLMSVTLALGLADCLNVPSAAQSETPPALEFDAASIKPTTAVSDISGRALSLVYRSGAAVYGQYARLEDLIRFAYRPMPFTTILGGPSWIRSIRYDAKPAREVSLSDLRAMMRSLLKERFHLTAHMEDRETDVYLMQLARGGPKFKPTAGPEGSVRSTGPYTIRARSGTMAQLAFHMNVWVVRCPVLDKTGLDGFYDFILQWAVPDSTSGGSEQDNIVTYSVLKALQDQLGLRLTPTKAPIPTVIVDHAERPTEN